MGKHSRYREGEYVLVFSRREVTYLMKVTTEQDGLVWGRRQNSRSGIEFQYDSYHAVPAETVSIYLP